MVHPEESIRSGITLSPLESPPDQEKKKASAKIEPPAKETSVSTEPTMLSFDQATKARQAIAEKGIMSVDKETRGALREYEKATQPSYPADELLQALREKNLNAKSLGANLERYINPDGKPYITLDDFSRDINLLLGVGGEQILRKQAMEQGVSFYDLAADVIEKNLGVKAVRQNS